jgi:nucleoside-diphosphate-sugar epimerase
MSSSLHCLVTGASGYIGGRLVPELLGAGYAVRCMARDPAKLSDRPWSDDVEITVADATDESAVRCALQGVDVAYYLIHSLGTGASFERRDRTAAQTFAAVAKAAGVQRIVYLGGIICGQAGTLSPHLRSRAGLPVAEKVDNAAAYLRYRFGVRAAELPDHALHRDRANRLRLDPARSAQPALSAHWNMERQTPLAAGDRRHDQLLVP